MSSIIFLLCKLKTLETSLTVSIITLKKLLESLHNLKHKDVLSLFHINKCFFPENIEEIEYFLDKIKTDFDVIRY